MKKSSLLVFFSYAVLLLVAGCSSDKRELPEIVQIKRVNPYHTVSEGDTVGSIASQYGMSRADLIKLNNLEQPYQLYDGQRLVITVKPQDTADTNEIILTGEKPAPADTVEDVVDESKGINDTTNAEDDATVDDIQEKDELLQTKTEYIWPVENGRNKISRYFGENEVEGGIVINASAGTPVKAMADGVVMMSGVPSGEAAAYGITVVIKHTGKKTMSIYAGLLEAKVKARQKIKQGAVIGKVGKSGSMATKPQLYLELNDLSGKGRKVMDLLKVLP
ncbi:MAG: M23 family metallopeptidase [Holosporales bacterium]|jgi:lipoprotein NlpD|nr:M23 family metallopeptidase [Holosporales bacterium]